MTTADEPTDTEQPELVHNLIAYCLQEAKKQLETANQPPSGDSRNWYIDVADAWRRLADSCAEHYRFLP